MPSRPRQTSTQLILLMVLPGDLDPSTRSELIHCQRNTALSLSDRRSSPACLRRGQLGLSSPSIDVLRGIICYTEGAVRKEQLWRSPLYPRRRRQFDSQRQQSPSWGGYTISIDRGMLVRKPVMARTTSNHTTVRTYPKQRNRGLLDEMTSSAKHKLPFAVRWKFSM